MITVEDLQKELKRLKVKPKDVLTGCTCGEELYVWRNEKEYAKIQLRNPPTL